MIPPFLRLLRFRLYYSGFCRGNQVRRVQKCAETAIFPSDAPLPAKVHKNSGQIPGNFVLFPLYNGFPVWYNNVTSARGFFFVRPPLLSSVRESAGDHPLPFRRGRYDTGRASSSATARTGPNFQGGADMRVKITLACSECKQRNYDTKKNKKNDPDRLELKKYCRFCRKHTVHRETK